MEPFENELLPDLPVIVNTTYETWENARDFQAGTDDVIRLMEQAGQPCYYVCDLTRFRFDFNTLIQSASMGTKGTSALLTHPLMKEFIVVTNSRVIELAANGLSHERFGKVHVKVFNDKQEAVEYAKEKARQDAGTDG